MNIIDDEEMMKNHIQKDDAGSEVCGVCNVLCMFCVLACSCVCVERKRERGMMPQMAPKDSDRAVAEAL